jgi:beta-galactosidase
MTICFISLFLAGPFAQTFPRQDVRFSDGWKFNRGDPANAQLATVSDATWDAVCLPHTIRLESAITHSNYDYYVGPTWYRKSFVPDPSFKGKKVFLEFEAAMQTSTIYLNGTQIFSYLGGYNPFTIDISGLLQYNATNLLAVRVNNAVDSRVSPGNPAPDFYYYSGLYRDVNLHVTDSLHITDAVYADKVAGGGIFVTYPSVSASSATVQVQTNVINEYKTVKNCVVTTSLIDSNGAVLKVLSSNGALGAGKDTNFTQSFTVVNPRLWNPNAPNLYTALSQVFDDTRPTDQVRTTIGIKTIVFSRSGGFVLNGSRIVCRGANRHQDFGCVGYAVPASGQYRDALLLKEAGFNFVRLGHYLESRYFLDACDKLGIMVDACLTGDWNTAGYSQPVFVSNSLRDERVMIRYYRNHASVITWESVHNESTPPANFCDSVQRIAHAEYPGNQMYTCGQETNNVLDIYLAAVQQGARTYNTTKPTGISEYGHWEYGGCTSTSNVTRVNGESGMLRQAFNHAQSLSTDRGLSWLSFDAVWVYDDYFGMPCYANNLCSGGVVDIFRLPKFSYYMFQSQRDPSVIIPEAKSGPMARIASFWTAASRIDSLWVFSNCDSVSLFLNNTLVAKKGPWSSSSINNLEHRPFLFSVSAFQAGTLRAEGTIGGAIKATHEVKTPIAAKKIQIALDTANQSLLADGSDLAMVYASIVDSNGTLMPAAVNSVTFSVSGPGVILAGDGNPLAAVAGIATVYVQTKFNQPGLITVFANASGLTSGSASVTSIPPTNGLVGINEKLAAPAALAFNNREIRAIREGNGSLKFFIPRDIAEGAANAQFTLSNVQGRRVCSWSVSLGKDASIHAGRLPAGIYFGVVTAGPKRYSAKAMVCP